MSLDFSGKRVLVVGGSSGIGNGIAQGFRDHGADVAVWGTRASAADYDGAEGSDLSGLGYTQVDISTYEAIEAAPMPFDTLDVLVLSQGIVKYKRQEFERAGWDAVTSVNLDSLMFCAQKFREQLAEAKGSLLIISSVGGFGGVIGNPAYAASKAGAVSLTKTLGQAYARDGIRVNGIAPGLVDTKLTKVTTDNPDRLEAAVKGIPLRREGKPADIAGPALFLASDMASYVCGQTLIVDGGMTL